MPRPSPFITGRVVPPEQFFGRRRERNSAVSLISTGQSLAFTGDPRIGKTSLLHYLASPHCQDLHEPEDRQRLFVYLDSQTWPDEFTPSRFWKRALQPLEQAFSRSEAPADLQTALRTAAEEGYATFVLERLLAQMRTAGWQLVLLLDEFDTLLEHPMLQRTEFYGGLRSLASRYGEALTLVLAARRSLSELNEATRAYSRLGSPFFNFVREVPLSSCSKTACENLLKKVAPHFTPRERALLWSLTGGFPYLLQIAGDALWHAHEDGSDAMEVWESVALDLLRAADDGLRVVWRHWTPDMRKVFVALALSANQGRVGRRNFDHQALRKILDDAPRALRELRTRGYVCRDEQDRLGHAITAWVLEWWALEHLLEAARQNDDLGQWLGREEWLGVLKRRELNALGKPLRALGQWLDKAGLTFAEAWARELARQAGG